MNVESAVLGRYSEGAKEKQDALCCPVDYDNSLLELLPEEILEKDYGCGDPSRHVKEGDIVLDLGSGSGKNCYMVAQLVGKQGRVIGLDMNDDMLALARKYQQEMAEKLGNDRVTFLKGRIQDLALDVSAMEQWLARHPVGDHQSLIKFENWREKQRYTSPMIKNNSIDLVISNCVLNLVSDVDKQYLVNEIYRVVKPGGRIAISDIVSDEVVPDKLKQDETLWSGCISGAFQEQEILGKFTDAGFIGLCFDNWATDPWQVVDGIEFRSVTLTGYKPRSAECLDMGHAVIYRGPFSFVIDDEGHEFPRGARMAVCERTFDFLTNGPYRNAFIGIAPAGEYEPRTWCAPPGTRRPAAETKGGIHYKNTSGSCC
jgi:arsenite methyltransferase